MIAKLLLGIVTSAIVVSIAGCSRTQPEEAPFVYTPPLGLVPEAAPEEMWLLLIDPRSSDEELRSALKPRRQVEYPVLRQLEVNSAADRKLLIDALRDAIRLSDGQAAACFWPRHILRMTIDGRQRDYVMCFECSRLVIFEDGKLTGKTAICPDQRAVFNRYLSNSKNPIAPSSL